MSIKAEATYQIVSWEETTWDGKSGQEVVGAKLTLANVKKTFQGDIEGESELKYLMSYREDGTATFVGLERVVGKLGGKSGSFDVQHSGIYNGEKAKSTWVIIAGSGTDELQGLRGKGDLVVAGHEQLHPITLYYSF